MSTAVENRASSPWNKRLGQPWHSAILALVGVVCALVTFANWRATDEFLASSVTAEGTVVSQLRDGGYLYPVVGYHDARGVEHQIRARTSPAFEPLMLQQKVTVRYVPATPALARIDNFWELWLDTAVSMLLAAAFFAGALFLWGLRQNLYSLDAEGCGPAQSPGTA